MQQEVKPGALSAAHPPEYISVPFTADLRNAFARASAQLEMDAGRLVSILARAGARDVVGTAIQLREGGHALPEDHPFLRLAEVLEAGGFGPPCRCEVTPAGERELAGGELIDEEPNGDWRAPATGAP